MNESRRVNILKICVVELGILKDWAITEDMVFSSSSAATTFIIRYAINGPKN